MAMEALNGPNFNNGTFHYAFKCCRRQPTLFESSAGHSSRPLGYLIGSSFFDNRLQTTSVTITRRRSALYKNYPIISAFKRIAGAPKRRNALRPKLVKLGEVRELDSKPDSNIIEDKILLPEKSSESLEAKPNKVLEESTGEGFVENAYPLEGNEIKTTGPEFWDTLEKWSSQYQEDVRFWGIGTAPVLIVHENANGDVQSVSVDEDEILRRSGIQPILAQFTYEKTMSTAYTKIARAKLLAREIEMGIFKPPRNSTLYKFVKASKNRLQKSQEGLRTIIGQVSVVFGRLPFIVKFSIVTFAVFHACCFVSAAQKYLFSDVPLEGKNMDEEKKKMVMRKMKSRMEKERIEANFVGKDERVSDLKLAKGQTRMDGAESQKEGLVPVNMYKGMPAMDERELEKRILATMSSKGKLPMDEVEFDKKVLMIRAMAREARKIEQQNSSNLSEDGRNVVEVDRNADDAGHLNAATSVADEGSNGRITELRPMEARKIEQQNSSNLNKDGRNAVEVDRNADDAGHLNAATSVADEGSNGRITELRPMEACKIEQQSSSKLNMVERNAVEVDRNADVAGELDAATAVADESSTGRANGLRLMDVSSSTGTLERFSTPFRKQSQRLKPRVITSIQEARAILASKCGEPANSGSDDHRKHGAVTGSDISLRGGVGHHEQQKIRDPFCPHNEDLFLPVSSSANENLAEKQTETRVDGTVIEENYEKLRPAFQKAEFDSQKKVADKKTEGEDMLHPRGTTLLESTKEKTNADTHEDEVDAGLQIETQSNLHEGNTGVSTEEEEFDWMRDEILREIVFKVKANEDAGRESFYGLDSEEEHLFYKGIESKFEREAERMKKWVDERIENLDYGKDGIGFDDPPEACMAKWKDPGKASTSCILEKFREDRQKFIRDKMEQYRPPVSQVDSPSVMTKSSSKSESSVVSSSKSRFSINDIEGTSSKDSSRAKTIISSSGKSSKFVNHSPRESWQHTKKWSRALQEKYNAEGDPEIKALMRDLGQDLDRWITEEEVKEASQFLSKGTKEQLEYFERIKARMQKESEMFGREAMISKYSEYKPEVEDHLWWVDLPYVLCIELYGNKDGEMMQGLYSLEMAPDLDSDSKRYHIVAFQDRGDATNFCYILQSYLSKLENGRAYVILRHPKELYREAKFEGFRVTVIKKAQIQLYIDQTLQEVESIITGIGSTMYYDKILQERAIDIHSVLDSGFAYGSP